MRLCIHDFETNGPDPETCEPVELSIIDAKTREVLFHSRMKPTSGIPERATEVHGISMEDVKDAPSPKELMQQVLDAISGYDYIAGYNNHHYDDQVWRRYFGPLPLPSFDLFRHVLTDDRRQYHGFKLIEVYRHLVGEVDEDLAHAALFDCTMVGDILEVLSLDVEEEVKKQKKPLVYKIMPYGKFGGKPLAKVPNGYIDFMLKKGTSGDLEHTFLTEKNRRKQSRLKMKEQAREERRTQRKVI